MIAAVALGARAAMIGRPRAYGLVAGGAGVADVLSSMREDMVRTLRLLGANSVEELDASFVRLALGEGPIPP